MPKLLAALAATVGVGVLFVTALLNTHHQVPNTSYVPPANTQVAQVSGALGQGLIAYWNLDETSGSTAADSSGSGNSGSLSGTTWTVGRVAGAASFGGSASASRSFNLSGTSAFSVSMWLNGSSLANILETTTNFNSSQTGVLVFVNDSPTCGANTIGVELKGNVGYNVKCYSYPGSGWHHYAFIFDKSQPGTGEVSLYVDGSLQSAVSNPQKSDNTNTFGSDTLYLMSRAGNASFSSGTVDEFRVYNRALTQSDVTALYGYTTPPTTNNKFKVGDRIRITVSDADIYSSPTISSTKLGRQAPGALGTVVAGPATAEGHTWYSYNFDSGVDGWDWQDDAILDNNPPPPPPPTLVTISSVVVTNPTTSGATISWLTNVAADTQVYYGLTSSYGSNTALNSTPVTSHTATLTGLTPNTVYHYQVRSGITGSSAASTDATFTTLTAPTVLPTPPTNLRATPVSSSQIDLVWTASSPGTNPTAGYRIYRAGTLIQSTTGSGTTFSDTNLTANTSYSYSVAAYDTAGNSSVQNPSVSATTLGVVIGCDPVAGMSVGSRIRTTSSVNVRSSATNVNSSNLLGTQPQDALGTILAGPTSGNNLCWYNVNYDSGVDGWTGGNNLTAGPTTPNSFTFSVLKIGSGSGTVTCNGTTCPSSFTAGTSVTLAATPVGSATFTGWTSTPAGICSGTNPSCTFTVGANTTITASFNAIVTCSTVFAAGTRVRTTANANVRATPATSGSLLGTQSINALGTIVSGPTSADNYCWYNTNFDSGVDGWTIGDNLTTYSTPTTVTLGVVKNGTGSGTVTCGGTTCPTSVNTGTSVTLAAAPASGSTFAGWSSSPSGLCSGTATSCTTTLSGNSTITATFNTTVVSGNYTITAVKNGNGTGKIASLLGSIDCGAICAATITSGNTVTMNATPDLGSTLTSLTLSPADSGTCVPLTLALGTCTVSNNTTITATFAAVVDTTAPSKPTNLVATAVSPSQINLTWTASTDNVVVSGYKIFRGGSQIGTSPTASYQDSTVSPSSTYSYTVSAYDVAGNNSDQSSAASASTPAVPPAGQSPIPAVRMIDWTQTGIPGGIPNYPNSINGNAAPYNATPNDSSDDTAAIRSALSAAANGTAVYLSPGTYNIGSQFKMPNGKAVVLRGTGSTPGATVLNFTGSNYNGVEFDGGNYITYGGNGVRHNITGGYTKDSRTLTVDSASGVTAGGYISIYQANDSTVNNWRSGSDCEGGMNGTNCIQQFAKVTAVSGNTITLDRPIYYPGAASGSGKQIQTVNFGSYDSGLENLKLSRANGATGIGVYFHFARNSWLKNIETYNMGGHSAQPHVMIDGSFGLEIRNSYFHNGNADSLESHASGGNYGLEIYRWNSNHKIENNIFTEHRHSIILEGGTANAILYNYVDDNWEYTSSSADKNFLTGDIGTHSAHPYMNLIEGNVNSKTRLDITLGSSGYNVVFRNWIRGMRNNIPASWGQWAVDIQQDNTSETVVGNVIGVPSWTSGTVTANGSCSPEPAAFRFGCDGNPGGYANSTPYNTVIRWGNYDYITDGVATWDGGASLGIPPSLIYLAKPSYFGSLAWPAFGPASTGTSGVIFGNIPAKKCYDDSAKDSRRIITNFNPVSCYGN